MMMIKSKVKDLKFGDKFSMSKSGQVWRYAGFVMEEFGQRRHYYLVEEETLNMLSSFVLTYENGYKKEVWVVTPAIIDPKEEPYKIIELDDIREEDPYIKGILSK
jgi:hypothetical protein